MYFYIHCKALLANVRVSKSCFPLCNVECIACQHTRRVIFFKNGNITVYSITISLVIN